MFGMDFDFFRQVSTFLQAIFDGVFLLFRLSVQKYRNICALGGFFSSDKFRLFN